MDSNDKKYRNQLNSECDICSLWEKMSISPMITHSSLIKIRILPKFVEELEERLRLRFMRFSEYICSVSSGCITDEVFFKDALRESLISCSKENVLGIMIQAGIFSNPPNGDLLSLYCTNSEFHSILDSILCGLLLERIVPDTDVD